MRSTIIGGGWGLNQSSDHWCHTSLLARVQTCFRETRVVCSRFRTHWVPSSFEITIGASVMCLTGAVLRNPLTKWVEDTTAFGSAAAVNIIPHCGGTRRCSGCTLILAHRMATKRVASTTSVHACPRVKHKFHWLGSRGSRGSRSCCIS